MGRPHPLQVNSVLRCLFQGRTLANRGVAVPTGVTTTEPPLQLVQDLIDALAGGGLNAIIGGPQRTNAAAEDTERKLGKVNSTCFGYLSQFVTVCINTCKVLRIQFRL